MANLRSINMFANTDIANISANEYDMPNPNTVFIHQIIPAPNRTNMPPAIINIPVILAIILKIIKHNFVPSLTAPPLVRDGGVRHCPGVPRYYLQ